MKTEAEIQEKIDSSKKRTLCSNIKYTVGYIDALQWVLSSLVKPDRYHQQHYYALVRDKLRTLGLWYDNFYEKEIGAHYRTGSTIEECVEAMIDFYSSKTPTTNA